MHDENGVTLELQVLQIDTTCSGTTPSHIVETEQRNPRPQEYYSLFLLDAYVFGELGRKFTARRLASHRRPSYRSRGKDCE
jgi:hypothetical protein